MAYKAARTPAEESTHPDRLSAPLNELLAHGRSFTTGDYEVRAVRRAEGALRGAAPKGSTVTGSPVLSRPWQLLGLPAVTVPGHRVAQGMPLGLQLVRHPDRLEGLFSLGHAVEQAARANG
ncbi:hypothetical protein [Streptomyces mirabilis]|uniref:hypothetical protein n=1 Tax=Streptomyces mirabilis TaxID=68239 RepID=UPI0033272B98